MNNTDSELQPGKSYQRPKHWGDDIQEGDIFRVSTEYIESHHGTTCLEGGYYLAQKEAETQKEYPEFPGWGRNNSCFKHAWTNINKIQMLLDDKSTTGELYGNGLNQLAITVLYIPVDSTPDLRVVPLSPAVERAVIFSLNNYNTGEPLPEGWDETTEPSEFLSSPIGTPSRQTHATTGDDSTYRRVLYISCRPDTKQREVSLGLTLTLPDGSKFTEYISSPAALHAMVNLKALEPVVYSVANTHQTKSERTNHTNYYLFPAATGYDFVKSEKIKGLRDDRKKEGVVGYKSFDGYERYVYYWSFTVRKETKIHLGIKPYITAEINDQPGAVTLTRTSQYDVSYFPGQEQDSRECTFRVYDQYGNNGLFKNEGSTGLWGEESTSDTYWYDIHIVDA